MIGSVLYMLLKAEKLSLELHKQLKKTTLYFRMTVLY